MTVATPAGSSNLNPSTFRSSDDRPPYPGLCLAMGHSDPQICRCANPSGDLVAARALADVALHVGRRARRRVVARTRRRCRRMATHRRVDRWALVLVASLIPRPVTLTLLRFAMPARAPARRLGLHRRRRDATAVDRTRDRGGVRGRARAPRGWPTTSWTASSYGDERRFVAAGAGRAASPGPIPLIWAAVVAGVAVGPLCSPAWRVGWTRGRRVARHGWSAPPWWRRPVAAHAVEPLRGVRARRAHAGRPVDPDRVGTVPPGRACAPRSGVDRHRRARPVPTGARPGAAGRHGRADRA